MLTCMCTLAGTKACLACPAYQNQMWHDSQTIPNVKPVRKVTEKYDEAGNLIERIIEEG